MRILGEADIDERPLRSRRIGIIGYGNQGRAHALNLHDGGWDVRVGVRAGGLSESRVRGDGLLPEEPAAVADWADVIMVLIPDEHQAELLASLAKVIRPDDAIGFAHGFGIAFDLVRLPPDTGVFLVAPCAPGARLREAFEQGSGVFSYVATREGDERYLPLALAYSRAIGCARAGVLVTTFREEAEVDLFGEQSVLCGGLHALIEAACDTLIEAGYAPEMAYLECVHQLTWLAATVHREGIAGTRRSISSTALYGDLTRGPRIVDDRSRAAMREILTEIRSGAFAKEFVRESADGLASARRNLSRFEQHPTEVAGRELRRRLDMLGEDQQEPEQGSRG